MLGFFEKKPLSDPSLLVDLALDETLQSNVSGLYVAGELSGIPLLKNAINQGAEAIERIASQLDGGSAKAEEMDVVIVGAGAAGLSAAMRAQKKNLRYLALDQGKAANTLAGFPPEKWLFAEPEGAPVLSDLWFEESETRALLERWKEQRRAAGLNLSLGERALAIRGSRGRFEVLTDRRTLKARFVVVAVGKQGNPRRLNVPGEELEKVSHHLHCPEKYEKKRIAVIGGGDSAIEAVLSLSGKNRVTLIVRAAQLTRPKARNLQALNKLVSDDGADVLFESWIKEIGPNDLLVETAGAGQRRIENDRVFALLGSDPPHDFLKRSGIRFLKSWTLGRVAFLFAFLGFIIAYYLARQAGSVDRFSNHLAARYGLPDFFPGGVADFFSNLTGSWPYWWGGAFYTAFVVGPGIYYIFKKQPRHYQGRKYLQLRNASVIFFQLVFFFLLPEILSTKLPAAWGSGGDYYSLFYAWPLTIFGPAGKWRAMAENGLGARPDVLFWGAWSLFLAFVAMPVFVYFHGKRYCSWICGCGALAETSGEPFRRLAPGGAVNRKRERIIYFILIWSVLITAVVLLKPVLGEAGETVPHYYKFFVALVFSGIVGVGLYPFFGARVWCRYGCPLAAYMNLLGAIKSRFKIVSNDKCIDCGQCNRYCEMGIDVKGFALKQKPVTLRETPCVGCGECVAVCPMNVLGFRDRDVSTKTEGVG